jgi:hypothetical protein
MDLLRIVPRSPGNVVVRTRRVPAHAEPANQRTLRVIKSQSAAKHIYARRSVFPMECAYLGGRGTENNF